MNVRIVEPEIVTYLEMRSPAQLTAPEADSTGLAVQEITDGAAAFGRRMYELVGGDWLWLDRRSWQAEEWEARYADANVRIWRAESDRVTAGYFELERAEDGAVEIAYFGLLPGFIGRRLGGALLAAAVRTAWDWDAARVWVHTSSRDHASALPNYKARGFRVFRTEKIATPARKGN